jgi:hypothetical protein
LLIKLLPSLLLYPILPLLGWGPITHAYINEKVLKHLRDMSGPDDATARKALEQDNADEYFIQTAGYPDIIKAKGFLKGDASYDYAHNPIPNRYYGQPKFAHEIFEHSIKSGDLELTTLALSWRTHQICDVFAHHAPIDKFWGYANRETFFGAFWHEVLDHFGEENVGELPGAFYRADHWMCELIIDLYCYLEKGRDWGFSFLRDAPLKPLAILPDISRAFIDKYADTFRHEYKKIEPIEYKQVLRGKLFSDVLNNATLRYCDSLVKKRSGKTLMNMINSHAKFDGLKGMLDKVAYITAKALINPSAPWTAPKIVPDLFLSDNDFYDDTFPGILESADYDNYYSEQIEKECQRYTPKRNGIVKLVLERMPITPIRWFVKHTPLVTGGNAVNRYLLPNTHDSYSLSLRFSYNLRERDDEDFMVILRRSLEEADIIAKT